MSWWLAKEHCKKNGGKLVEIDLEEENRALVEEIKRNRFTERHMNFWIGPEWQDKWSDLECGIDRFINSKYPATITLHALCEFEDLTSTTSITSTKSAISTTSTTINTTSTSNLTSTEGV